MPLFEQLAALTNPTANSTGVAKTADRSSNALNNGTTRSISRETGRQSARIKYDQ